MTIEQMLMVAKIFLALAVIGGVGSVVLFFLLDIRKAFHIVTGSTYRMRYKKKDMHNAPTIKSSVIKQTVSNSDEFVTRVLDMSMVGSDAYEPTVVLDNGSMDETIVLGANTKKVEMLVDITFIHTEIII